MKNAASRFALLIATTSALTLASCSSGDGGTAATTSTAPTSTTTSTVDPAAAKATFLADGNAICATMNDESAAITGSYGPQGPDDPAVAAELIRASADLIDGAITDLRELPQPAGDEAALEAMYADGEAVADLGRELADALASGDRATAGQLGQELDAAQEAANADLDAYGLTECGSGS